jgi:hypothetical protein
VGVATPDHQHGRGESDAVAEQDVTEAKPGAPTREGDTAE